MRYIRLYLGFSLLIAITDAFSISIPSYMMKISSKSTLLTALSYHKKTTLHTILDMKDYPKPNIENTQNYREATALSNRFKDLKSILPVSSKKKVAIIGGGLSGLAAAKYLVDAGYEPLVLEARDVLGGKVSAWQDEDGDWIETGLHIFFGAYPNMMNLLKELNIEDRLQWKAHQMIFALQNLPGEFTTFDFIPGIPAPFNIALAILLNQKMLTLGEKLQTATPLLPMLIQGQEFIDAQDELSVTQFMTKYGMPDRINDEVFIAMAKALDFIDPDKLSMTVVLTVMNRFLNEDNGSQMAFLDGNQPDRVCAPMKEYIEARGGTVRIRTPVNEIQTNTDGSIKALLLKSGEIIIADEYISSVPVDIMKLLLPKAWSKIPYFRQMDELEGIPVINLHLWFDRKLKSVDHVCFSRSELLSVYADMSVTCKEYYDPERSMLELVFAPCSPLAGGKVNWMSKSDDEIIAATMNELTRLFPSEIANDGSKAKLRKFAVVRTPRSVYAAIPGRNKYRPSQVTPIDHFTLAGDWTFQKFLGSMEGAILAGKLAAQVIVEKALRLDPAVSSKPIRQEIVDAAEKYVAKEPLGISDDGPFAYGGGTTLSEFRIEDTINPKDDMDSSDDKDSEENLPKKRVYGKSKPFDLTTVNDNIR